MATDQERYLNKKIQSLEWALEAEKKKNIESYKGLCKRDRLIKELTFKSEQDKIAMKDLQVVIGDLESTLKVYKNKIQNVVSLTFLFGLCTFYRQINCNI